MAGKLLRAEWENWPMEESSAVRAAFLAAWVWTLEQDAAEWDPGRWLCGLAVLGDVADALEAWRRSPSPHAVERLGIFAYDHLDRLAFGGAIGGAFWDDAAPGTREQVTAWLLGTDVRRWLCDAPAPAETYVRWRFDAARAVLCVDDDPA